jgi:ankyrin repeat protein
MANATELSLKLFQAVLKGNVLAVKKLLEEGADPNVKSPDGSYPILAAVTYGNLEIIRPTNISNRHLE